MDMNAWTMPNDVSNSPDFIVAFRFAHFTIHSAHLTSLPPSYFIEHSSGGSKNLSSNKHF